MCALDFLGVLFAGGVLLGSNRALIGAPAVGVEARNAKRFSYRLQAEHDVILPSSEHIGQDLARVVMLGRRKARYLAARFLTPPV